MSDILTQTFGLLAPILSDRVYDRIGDIEERAIQNDRDTVAEISQYAKLNYRATDPLNLAHALLTRIIKDEAAKSQSYKNWKNRSKNQTLKEADTQ